jgi:hypothetical protein
MAALYAVRLNGPSTATLYDARMIDNFALGLTHGLMLLAAWRLLARPELDDDDMNSAPRRGWLGKGRRGDA